MDRVEAQIVGVTNVLNCASLLQESNNSLFVTLIELDHFFHDNIFCLLLFICAVPLFDCYCSAVSEGCFFLIQNAISPKHTVSLLINVFIWFAIFSHFPGILTIFDPSTLAISILYAFLSHHAKVFYLFINYSAFRWLKLYFNGFSESWCCLRL